MKPTTSLLAIAALLMIGCGSSPAAPTKSGSSVSGVALAATSVAAGSTGQGTVTLLTPASSGGASVALSSSNPLVATVQTPVTVQAGASSAPFTITALTAGTATITALLEGTSGQSPMFTVTAPAAPASLSAIVLSASTVVGGGAVTGTAILTSAAPAGGAVVLLSGSEPVIVPQSVTVAAGSMRATFNITTTTIRSATDVTISGSYAGAYASAVLSITQPTVAIASFGVAGPSVTETCAMADGGATLNCTFDGSTSTAPGTIVAWDWSYILAATFAQTTTGPVLTMPAVNCSLLPAPPLPADALWFTMRVSLRIHDDLGNTAVATNGDVRLMPQGVCGF